MSSSNNDASNNNIIRDGLNAINNYWMSIPIPDAFRALITVLVFRNILFAIRRYFFGDERELARNGGDKGLVVECESLEQVEKEIEKAKRREKAVMIDYGATWCPPCRRMKPLYAKMSRELHWETHGLFLRASMIKQLARLHDLRLSCWRDPHIR